MFSVFQLPEDLTDRSPAYTLPMGPVWQARAREVLERYEDGEVRYLIRQLSAPTGMLKTGAVLAQASRFEHPRLYGPSYWTRGAGRTLWVTTLRPLGEPLTVALDLGLDWEEALRLWTPLAEAVQRAHQRGLVHGSLSPWTVWYSGETEQLTAVEAGSWVGDAFEMLEGEARAWIAPELRVSAALRVPTPFADMYGLARLLVRLLVGADAPLTTDALPIFAQPAFDRALATDPEERLSRVEDLLAATTPSLLDAVDPRVAEATSERITTVLNAAVSAREDFQHPRLGAGVRFYLNLSGSPNPDVVTMADDEGQLGAFFYEGVDRSLYDSVKWAWEGAQVHLLDARVVTDSRQRTFITSHPETLPVVEPTFPISVSNVLKAERCTSRFLVDERDGGSSSKALVLGNIVHGLLEDLTAPSPPEFDAAFNNHVSQQRLALLAAGLTDGDMDSLRKDAAQHFRNLRRFTEERAQRTGKAQQVVSLQRQRSGSVYNHGKEQTGWSGRQIEVTRYSPLYGLEGRIDLATEDAEDGLQIIELKSGSAWDGHLSQVRCYTLLWDGLARHRGLGISGYVLYSRYGRLNAVPMDDVSRERRILRARNELMACHRSFVDPSFEYTPPHFMQNPRDCNAPTCKFRRERCREQTAVLGLEPEATPELAAAAGGVWAGVEPELVARAWAWWRHVNRLVEMERWAQHAALGIIFQPGRLPERVANHKAITGMRISSIDLDRNTITFSGPGTQIFSPRSAILAHRNDLHNAHILQGYVADVGGGSVTIRTQGAQIAAALDPNDWVLDDLPARIGIRHAKRAMYAFMRRRDPMHLQAILAPESPEAAPLFSMPEAIESSGEVAIPARPGDGELAALNATQQRALALAVHAPVGALIQGPPGTGKTTVIARIVRELLARGQRVLVCAQTNTAVDTILRKVISVGERGFLRIGRVERSRELAMALASEGLEPERFFTQDLGARTPSLDTLSETLQRCMLYGCTTHAATNAPVFELLRRARHGTRQRGPLFDTVIIDEASQINEPMTLAAINHARRFVLVGDHRQLPPIVQSEQALSAFFDPNASAALDAEEIEAEQDVSTPAPDAHDLLDLPRLFELDEGLREAGVGGLDRSLFERLITRLPHVMLEEQYRMHRDIMTFSNREFYGGKLSAHDSVAGHALSFHAPYFDALPASMQARLSAEVPVVFQHVEGHAAARSNRAEAEALVETLTALVHPEAFTREGGAPTVGVISPFRAQVQLIRTLLRERLGAEVEAWIDVDTVERYQGGERDIILVSLVKTERAGEFLSDTRRLNVTLTRARKKLILFGHRRCLMLNPLYRHLIEQPETDALAE